MAEQVKLCYRNILENSTVTVTSENTSYPKYRLYDRDIGKLFKGNSTPANFYITLDQGAVTSYEADRLIIPANHNLDGLVVKLQYSTDNFAADVNDALSWTQSGSALIDKTFTAQTKRYWRLNIASPASAPELSEMFLAKTYTFVANPLIGAREGWQRNVSSEETESGLDRDIKRGELRRRRDYELRDVASAQKTEFEAWEQLCEGVKPVWIIDHNGTALYMKMLNELEFTYDTEDSLGYSCVLHLREVLGQTI